MAKREPKTIDEARTLILAAVPNDTWVYISAHWHDHRNGGRTHASVTYRCSIEIDGKDHVVESHLPAQLCRLAIAVIIKAQGPLALPPAKPQPARRQPVSKIKGSMQPRLTFGG